MKLSKLIKKKYKGNAKRAAESSNSTHQYIRNCLSKDKDVIKLADGTYMLDVKKKVIFK